MNKRKIFFSLSMFFAGLLVILLIGSGPTDFGPQVSTFALPCAICSVGYAFVYAFLGREN